MRINVFLLAVVNLIACFSLAIGQSSDVTIGQEFTANDLLPSQFVPLEITPSQPAQSALTYRLFPEDGTLIDRNGAIYYHRAVYLLDTFEARLRGQNDDPDTTLAFDFRYLDSELTPEILKRMRTWLELHEYTLKEIGFAARSKQCDWQLIPEEVKDSWYFLHMTEIQSCRGLARLIAVKARIEVADGDFEEAVKTIQLGYKMATDIHRSDTIVGSLVANTCVGIMQTPLLELFQAPGSPSLFWPLATLPEELTDVREAIRSQLSSLRTGDGLFMDPQKPRTLNDWRAEANQYSDRLVLVTAINGGVNNATESVIRCYPIAKQLLLNNGVPAEKVDAMPSIQVVAIARSRISNWLLDEYEKGLRLDDLASQKYFAELERRLVDHPFNTSGISEYSLIPYVDVTLPPIQQLLQSSLYLQRKRCALQVIEALRLHLGATGKLPKTLDEISIVPIPKNPETGEPFRYEFKNDSAKLFDFGLREATAIVYEINPAGK